MPNENPVPIPVPWKVIAASPDMMDVRFGNDRFPFAWRSSLAVSVYEPSTEETPSPLCGQRIAFIKVSCSLTGYQTTGDEHGAVDFGDEPLEQLSRLTSEYLGCYGALLNVGFFPPPMLVVDGEGPNLQLYPRVLDFSPKSRELIGSITETGEVLTGSSRGVGIDQSKTTTTKSETSVGLEAGYEAGGLKATGNIKHTWGTTNEDKAGLSVDSGEHSESSHSYSTTMDQLYSLLSGYHTGTNRATVIMLARPGTVQPTNRRTFAPGLRMLEGVQDFVFVVSRPQEQDRLCIEASLHTGHFPENVDYVGTEDQTERRAFIFNVRARANGGSEGFFSFQGERIDFGSADRPQDVFTLPDDWVLDIDAPGSDHGISLSADRTHNDPDIDDNQPFNEMDLRVIRVDDHTVRAIGHVTARGGYDFSSGPDTVVDVDFIIHVKRPHADAIPPTVDAGQMLITRRNLNVCYRSTDGCPEIIDPHVPELSTPDSPWFEGLAVRGTGARALNTIRSALIDGTAALQRGAQTASFVETDYFSRKVVERLPRSLTSQPVAATVELKSYGPNVRKLLKSVSVSQLMATDLRKLESATGLKHDDALRLRRDVLLALEAQLGGQQKQKPRPRKPRRKKAR